MDHPELLFSIVPALILFIYGIENFSREILAVARGRFADVLGKLTRTPVRGAFLGAGLTALIQSSAATTVITVGLVNAGTISFVQSLGVIIGSNIGTTITAQLIAFKLTAFAPVLIVAGFILGFVGGKYKFLGKPVFYFGLVFFSLNLLSDALLPFQNDPEVIAIISGIDTPLFGILIGFLFTVMVQSSSVTTGIAVVLAQAGLITLPQGIFMLLGANIGSTTTSLIAAAPMGLYARRSAVAHFLFNLGGVLIILPFLDPFITLISDIGGTTAHEIANAHLLFNLMAAVFFIVFLTQFKYVVEHLVRGKEREILISTRYLSGNPSEDTALALELVEKELQYSFENTRVLFSEAAGLMVPDKTKDNQMIARLDALADHLDGRIDREIFLISRRPLSEHDAERTVILVRISNILARMSDRAVELAGAIRKVSSNQGRLPPELIAGIVEINLLFNESMRDLELNFPAVLTETVDMLRSNDTRIRGIISSSYREQLNRLRSESEFADSILIEILAILESSNDKLRDIRKLCEIYSLPGPGGPGS